MSPLDGTAGAPHAPETGRDEGGRREGWAGERRRLPYPFRAALAICSDLDETPDATAYLETARFLNTESDTAMGEGVGLEVGNTMYFDMAPGRFSYWNTDDASRERIGDLFRSGHIDCIHSYGDEAATRSRAARALEELARIGAAVKVWVDHATAPTNLGSDIMRGEGDLPGAPAYHADLTTSYGVRFVWRGRVTSVIGQGRPRSLAGIGDGRHPVASLRTLSKEAVKGFLGRAGHPKYAPHGTNELLAPVTLRDGNGAYEFLRSNPHWGGVSSSDRSDGLGAVITEGFLERLARREAESVLYTHLGKYDRSGPPLGESAREALRRLARHYRDGRILVAATGRLLELVRNRQEERVGTRVEGGKVRICVTFGDSSPRDLSGATYYTPSPEDTILEVEGRRIEGLVANGPDHTGRRSVSVPWKRLSFPLPA
jgi:hypothetical protein